MKYDYKDFIKRFFIMIFVSLIFTAIIFIFNGCMSKPDVKKYPQQMTELEKKLQYQYESCMYAQSYSKVDLRCNDILKDNQKIRFLLYYNTMKKNKKLPLLYDSKGSREMTFDDFFKYIK